MANNDTQIEQDDDAPIMHTLDNNPWAKKFKALLDGLESGKYTQAEFERKHRGLMVELQAQANKEREKVKKWAIESKKVRDEADYKRLCAYYHDEYGDSFHHFLTSIRVGANFLTMNPKMLDDARLLELKYGGKILSPEQAVALSEKEKAEEEAAKLKEETVDGTNEASESLS